MNKKKVIPLILSSMYVLSACSGTTTTTSQSSSQEEGGGEGETMDYDDFYKGNYSKVDEKTALQIHMASDGYRSMRSQGYNGFYYEVLKGENFEQISLNNGEFLQDDGVGFVDAFMTSKEGASATRMYKSGASIETITIKNSVYLVEGDSAQILIYKNSTILVEKTITSESLYFEIKTSVALNDELRFVVIGDAKVKYNPIIDYLNEPEKSLHTTCDGFYGDVHPYYNEEDGKVYMFYLSTGNQSLNRTATFTSMLTTSTDMIHYVDEECKLNDKKRPIQDLYFVLNVFKDREGVYRSSQGGNLTTVSSISSDLHIWENGSDAYMDDEGNLHWSYTTPFGSGVYSGRDPDTFYDKDTDKYYTVVLNYFSGMAANGEKHLVLYIGDGEGQYSDEIHKTINFTNRGDSECPQIKKIGKRWYLFYSVYGTGANGNVGRMAYRVGPEDVLPQDVDWNSISEQYIDGLDVHAAQIFNIGEKMYVYGWIHYQFNTNVWGGYLNLPHEVYVNEQDGSLNARLDEKLLSLLDKGLIYENPSIKVETELGDVYRHLIKATLTDSSSLTIGRYQISIVRDGFKMYLDCTNGAYSNRVEIQPDIEYKLAISMDANMWDICVNDSRIMTCHTDLAFPGKLVANPGQGEIKNLTISKLADLNNIYY